MQSTKYRKLVFSWWDEDRRVVNSWCFLDSDSSSPRNALETLAELGKSCLSKYRNW